MSDLETSSVLLEPSGLEEQEININIVSSNNIWSTNSKEGQQPDSSGPVPVSGKDKDIRDVENLAFLVAKNTDGHFDIEKVFPPDDRIQITSTSSWPWCVQGHMVMTFPNGKRYIGSGTMVQRHHVLTAGHCVYSRDDGGWAKEVAFYAGQNGNKLPFGVARATRLLSVKGWSENNNSDFDMGMLVLSDNIGDRTGYFGIITGPDSILDKYRVNITGYPGDKGGQQMWTMADTITAISAERFYYRIDTYGGQSGSCAWSEWSGHTGYKAGGIHTTGEATANGATRISRAKFDRIVSWMKDY